MYTLSPSFVELYLKVTKLCCFMRHAEPAVSKLSRVHWNSPELNPLSVEYRVWGAMLEKCH